MFLGDGDGHFRAMSVIVDADVLDVGEVVEVNVEDLGHEGGWLVVEVFVVEVVERFWVKSNVQMASFYRTM